MDDDVTEYPTRRVRLHPCQFCERQFNVDSLSKHQAICRKVSHRQRKQFDAGRQRATHSDVPYQATKRTAQVYKGEVAAQDHNRSKYGSKSNWRDKHRSLIQSIREARTVTLAMKQGKPLPAFRPSEVPSDYIQCPSCHRNFNQGAGQRHIPHCQAKHGHKQAQPSRSNQPWDRERPLPRQQQSYSTSAYAGHHDNYHADSKHINSAPMARRRNPSDYEQPPAQRVSGGDGHRKTYGPSSRQAPVPSRTYYEPEDEYEAPVRRPTQPAVLMRTGRSQENTSLNVHARQRSNEVGSYVRRLPPQAARSSSYGQPNYPSSTTRHDPMRPTGFNRPTLSTVVRCGDCGSLFSATASRYCPHCG